MKHVSTRVLFAYWDGLRGERAAPERGEIEPGAIRHVLADTFILDLEEPGRAVFRLAGTRLCALFGGEMKGQDFAALWRRQAGNDIDHMIATVTDDAAGVVGGAVGTTRRGATVNLELLLLPLRHRGRTNARLMGAISPAVVPSWIGFDPVESLSMLSLRVILPSGRKEDVPQQNRRPHLVVHNGGRS